MAQMQQGLAAWRATGAEVLRPYGLALLAKASAQVGQREAGLALLAEALAVLNDTGERRWEAELHRLKGELLLARAAGHDAEAETCFRQALDMARQPAGQILGATSGHEPEPLVAAAGQVRRGPRAAGARSMAGSPRASTLPTSRRPGRCSRRCREAIGVGSALARNSTSVLRGGQGLSGHARHEMRQEEFGPIPDQELYEAICTGEIIETYPDDTPYPSVLLFGTTHVN